ncbi:hypothetical protein LZ554_004343 [Drepanopeziza brunnea f. sp. 'monogermtubi']|nr:hypothetical protein LZ554_004343 [Drepanopeziza brunnea f. sp. 'monogermtubi']
MSNPSRIVPSPPKSMSIHKTISTTSVLQPSLYDRNIPCTPASALSKKKDAGISKSSGRRDKIEGKQQPGAHQPGAHQSWQSQSQRLSNKENLGGSENPRDKDKAQDETSSEDGDTDEDEDKDQDEDEDKDHDKDIVAVGASPASAPARKGEAHPSIKVQDHETAVTQLSAVMTNIRKTYSMTKWLQLPEIHSTLESSSYTLPPAFPQIIKLYPEDRIDYLLDGRAWMPGKEWSWDFTNLCIRCSWPVFDSKISDCAARSTDDSVFDTILRNGDLGSWSADAILYSTSRPSVLYGAIIHVNRIATPPQPKEAFLPSELSCACYLFGRAIYSSKDSDLATARYSTRIVSFTVTTLRIVSFTYDVASAQLSYVVVFSCDLMNVEDLDKLNADWLTAMAIALDTAILCPAKE